MSRSTLTLASSLLLAFTPSISPADAVLDAEQILSLLPYFLFFDYTFRDHRSR